MGPTVEEYRDKGRFGISCTSRDGPDERFADFAQEAVDKAKEVMDTVHKSIEEDEQTRYTAAEGDWLRLNSLFYKHIGVFEILGIKRMDGQEVVHLGKVGKSGTVLADNGIQTGKTATRIGYPRHKIERSVNSDDSVTVEQTADEGDA